MTDAPYLNQAAVKKLALRYSKENRAGRFTRVGKSFFARINAQVAHMVAAEMKKEETPLYIKRTAIKELAERISEEPGIKRRLDGATLKRINDRVYEIVVGEVQRHPSTGTTLT